MKAKIFDIACSFMLDVFKLTVHIFVVLASMFTLSFTHINYIEGQLAIPNITQREEQTGLSSDSEDSTKPTQPEEQITMQGIFSNTGKLIGFGLNVNNGSVLCPSNNCEFTIENGLLKHRNEGDYDLEGKLRVREQGNENFTIGLYNVKTDLRVKETFDEHPGMKFMTGFFDARSLTSNKSPHYYIYNGTLSMNSDNSTLILQGKVLTKMS